MNMMKKIKFEEAEEDRISSLPDCLLVEILLRLRSTKEAIKTSTISKRWKHVWTLVPTLDFTNDRREKDLLSRFFSSIDKILNQCSSQLKLNEFQLHTNYDVRFESQLSNWIRHAINRKVEHLNLKLPYVMGRFVLDRFFITSSCFTHMKLRYCVFNTSGAISWKNLKSLHITDGELDEDLIANILSGSPLLETLNLENCFIFRRLDITSKSVKNLGLFGFRGTPYDPEEIFEINAPNILSLTIGDVVFLRRLYLIDVSSLVKAKLTYRIWFSLKEEENEKIFKRLILNLAHVKELTIGRYCSQVFSRLKAKGFIPPLNMKVLLLDNGPKGYED